MKRPPPAKPAKPTRSAPPSAAPVTAEAKLARLFSCLMGGMLAIALLKLGNPITMESRVVRPVDAVEFLLNSWPAVWGYGVLLAVAVCGLVVVRRRPDLPRILVWLPAVWWLWQLLATLQSTDAGASSAILMHFALCLLCFYLGLFGLGRQAHPGEFWLPVLAGFLLVLGSGFLQHFGGLEATRKYFFEQIYPLATDVPPELIKRMSSTRIFATLFYPNTLAGVILLWLPILLAVIGSWQRQFTAGARGLLMALVAAPALACLFWSGSKGGWLLMLVTGFGAILALPFSRRAKQGMVGAVLVLGLTGFFVKYAGFFHKGATSVVARFEYWAAAARITAAHPLLGTGPGTFGAEYKLIKPPGAEMAMITHNDYFQQACDSGLPGLLLFTAFVVACLVFTWRHSGVRGDWLRRSVWLGLLAWALQATVEFPLYIPAMAWPAFVLCGWLIAQAPPDRLDKPSAPR